MTYTRILETLIILFKEYGGKTNVVLGEKKYVGVLGQL